MSSATPFLRAFFDNSRDGMYVSTPEGRFLDANQAFCRLLGWTKEELLERRVEDILELPGERRRFRAEIEANGAVSNFRVKLRHRSEGALTCTVDGVAVRGASGDPEAYIGQVRLQRPAAWVQDPEAERFTLALRGSHDGLWEWDLRRQEAFFSPRWGALLGLSPGELRPRIQEWFYRVHPEDLNSLKQSLNHYLKGEGAAFSTYFRMRHRSGEYLWMLARGVGDFNEEGRCDRLAGSLGNVTGHIRVIEQLKTQEQALAQLNESLRQDKSLLSQYFSGDMLARVLKGGAQAPVNLGPAALLTVHLNGVEGLWSQAGAQGFTEFLNEILTDLMDLVYGQGGSVNKILGDTLLTSFGAPLAQGDDAERALRCAGEMLRWLKTFNDVRPEWMAEPLTLSLGMSCGDVLSGSLGSVHRLEYTLLGRPLSRSTQLQILARRRNLSFLVDTSVARLRFKGWTWRPLGTSPELKGLYEAVPDPSAP